MVRIPRKKRTTEEKLQEVIDLLTDLFPRRECAVIVSKTYDFVIVNAKAIEVVATVSDGDLLDLIEQAAECVATRLGEGTPGETGEQDGLN
jgi:hypothetical protein